MTFDNYLGEVLGFPAETLYQRVDNRLKALNGAEDRTINILNEVFGLTRPKKKSIELIYVTSNITDYRLLIDNKFVNLLSIIKIPSNAERNELLHYNFDKAIYLPITENPMQRISLILNDLIGDKLCEIQTEGDFYFVLHFRKFRKREPIIIASDGNKSESKNNDPLDEDVDPFMLST